MSSWNGGQRVPPSGESLVARGYHAVHGPHNRPLRTRRHYAGIPGGENAPEGGLDQPDGPISRSGAAVGHNSRDGDAGQRRVEGLPFRSCSRRQPQGLNSPRIGTHPRLTAAVTAGYQDRMPTENTTFIAVHVPKCAGSSVERHMLENLPAKAVWMPRKRYRSMPAIKPPFFEPRREGTGDVRFVSGHHIGKSVEGYFPDHRILRSVLLREPMSFHLSYYNFRSMRYLGQGLNTYSFDDHLLSQRDDPISHFLLERWLEIPRAKLLSMPAQRKFDIINRDLPPGSSLAVM